MDFKTFVLNEALFNDAAEYLIEDGEWKENASQLVHRFNVGPHNVAVYYGKRKKGHYGVDYDVNGGFSKGTSRTEHPITDNHSQQILHHVASSVHHFVRNNKPKSLSLQPNNEGGKAKLYQQFGHHLAKHFGGKVKLGKLDHNSLWSDPPTEVHFKYKNA